jgi:hypothetical protein
MRAREVYEQHDRTDRARGAEELCPVRVVALVGPAGTARKRAPGGLGGVVSSGLRGTGVTPPRSRSLILNALSSEYQQVMRRSSQSWRSHSEHLTFSPLGDSPLAV